MGAFAGICGRCFIGPETLLRGQVMQSPKQLTTGLGRRPSLRLDLPAQAVSPSFPEGSRLRLRARSAREGVLYQTLTPALSSGTALSSDLRRRPWPGPWRLLRAEGPWNQLVATSRRRHTYLFGWKRRLQQWTERSRLERGLGSKDKRKRSVNENVW